MQTLTTIPDTLKLVESNSGDGGWSLHDARDTEQMIAEGDSTVLASGDRSVLLMDVEHALARLNDEWSIDDCGAYVLQYGEPSRDPDDYSAHNLEIDGVLQAPYVTGETAYVTRTHTGADPLKCKTCVESAFEKLV
jgi:hypothetical protein